MSAQPGLNPRHSGDRRLVELATTIEDIRGALTPHYRVFGHGFGEDAEGRHLLVRGGATGQIIGSPRLLPDRQAARTRGLLHRQ